MKPLRVGIDVRTIGPHMRGIGLSVLRLVTRLARMEECELVLFCSARTEPLLSTLVPSAQLVETAHTLGDSSWEETVAGGLCDELALDVYHGPAFGVALTGRCAKVVTVHDVSFTLYPEFFDPPFIDHMEKQVSAGVAAAHVILTPSLSAKDELQRFFGVPEERVVSIYHGVEPGYFVKPRESELKRVREKYRLREKVVMVVGMAQDRKNVQGVLRAFAGLPSGLRSTSTLLIVGESWNVNPRALMEAAHLGVQDDTVITGEIDDEELRVLYHAADVLCYPSFNEGFGMPIVEAMACGTPVLTSDRGAMKEVAGDSALLVDPEQVQSIRDGIAELLTDKSLADDLRKRGRERAGRFSWEKTARETLEAYKRAVSLATPRRSAFVQSVAEHGKRRLILGIDARFYGATHTGTGRVTTELIRALAAKPKHGLVLFGMPKEQIPPEGEVSLALAGEDRLLDPAWEQERLPTALRQKGCDAYLSLTGICPIASDIVKIAVAYDIGFEHHPEFFSPTLRTYLKQWLPQSFRSADRVVAISRFTARDLIDTYGLDPRKLSVAYPGTQHVLRAQKEDVGREGPRFILSVTSGGPNKNLRGLLRAFDALAQNTDVRLVIAGSLRPEDEALIRGHRFSERIATKPQLSDGELARLIRHASCLVHLSHFEGFGLPVAEAMASGVPVVASNQDALREITGNCALLVDPDNPAECAEAIVRVLLEPQLAGFLAQTARRRAASFTWSAMADHVLSKAEEAVLAREGSAEATSRATRSDGLRIGLVLTFGVECGIARYSERLSKALTERNQEVIVFAEEASGHEPSPGIHRCWRRGRSLERLADAICSESLDVVNIQYHPAFFPDDELAWLLWRLKSRGVPAIMTVHEIDSANPRPALIVPDEILVHTVPCERLLRQVSVGAAVAITPIGAPEAGDVKRERETDSAPIVLSFGFPHSSKGFHQIIDALPLLKTEFPRLRYRILSTQPGQPGGIAAVWRDRARANGVSEMVQLKEGFLPERELAAEIAAADLVAFPYVHDTVGASAAVSDALAAGAAVVTSHSSFFEDLGDAVLRATTPQEYAEHIGAILRDAALRDAMKRRALGVARERSWSNVAGTHVSAYADVIRRSAVRRASRITPWVSVQIVSKETDRLGLCLFESCLKSLKGYADEVIVADGGSSRDVIDMVQSALRAMNGRLIIHPEIRNRGDLRNVALEATSKAATHLLWVDTDEIFFPNQLAEFKHAAEDGDISSFQMACTDFVLDPTTIQGRRLRKRLHRLATGMRWSLGAGAVVEGAAPGRTAYVPVGCLRFGDCRPQWQVFLTWLNDALLEHGHVDVYRYETIGGRRLPWLRGARTPNTILEKNLQSLASYQGTYPETCRPWLEAWRQSGKTWAEHVEDLVDSAAWTRMQALRAQCGSWPEALPLIVGELCTGSSHS